MEQTEAAVRSRRWKILMAGVVLFTLVFRMIMQVDPLLEPVCLYFLSPLYVGFAALLFFDTDMMKQSGFRLMLLCLLWALVTSCLHTYDFTEATALMVNFLLMLFAFCMCYALAFVLPQETKWRAFNAICIAFVMSVFALCVVGVYTAVARVMIPSVGAGLYEPCGVVFGRLSIFAYPTIAAVFCALALLLLLYLFLAAKRIVPRIVYVLFAVVIYVAMALTDGRTASIFYCICFGGVIFLILQTKLQLNKRLWKTLISLAAAGAAAAVCYGGLLLSVRAVNALSDAILPEEKAASVAAVTEETELPPAGQAVRLSLTAQPAVPETSGSGDETENGEDPFADKEMFGTDSKSRSILFNLSTLQGRTYAWEGVLKAMREEPLLLLFGASPVQVMKRIDPYITEGTEAESFFHLHSIVFQTLASYGLPGLILFAAMIGYLLFHALRLFFCGAGVCTLAERALPLVLLFSLGVDLLEIFLTFTDVMKVSNPIFFLVGGYAVYLSKTRIPARRRTAAEE